MFTYGPLVTTLGGLLHLFIYSSAVLQSAYSTAPADWAGIGLYVNTDKTVRTLNN